MSRITNRYKKHATPAIILVLALLITATILSTQLLHAQITQNTYETKIRVRNFLGFVVSEAWIQQIITIDTNIGYTGDIACWAAFLWDCEVKYPYFETNILPGIQSISRILSHVRIWSPIWSLEENTWNRAEVNVLK